MKYIFFGTPRFAAIVLKALIEKGHLPSAIICNPDRPVGRKKILTAPPTKEIGIAHNIPVHQPGNKDELEALIPTLETYTPYIGIVAAYAQIIRKSVLDVPEHGTIGVHPSLLPLYRGATPIQSAILDGATETGTTIYHVDQKVDHGPILGQKTHPLTGTETYTELEKTLALLGVKVIEEMLPRCLEATLVPKPQDHENATHTQKFETKDGEVWIGKTPLQDIERKIRALHPEPGVFTYSLPGYEEKRVKLLEAKKDNNNLVITKIHVAGKNPQEVAIPLTE